jgi:hypothetical protein
LTGYRFILLEVLRILSAIPKKEFPVERIGGFVVQLF